MRALTAFDELLGRAVSMRALALLRVLAGPIVLLHLWPFLSDALEGRIYRDAFYEPYASWYPELPDTLLVCVTEVHGEPEIARLVDTLAEPRRQPRSVRR